MNTKLTLSILVLVAGLLITTSAQVQVAISEEGVTFQDGTVLTTGAKMYVAGDTGPAGGIVFHVTDDGLHGLEAAPQDQGSTEWGCLDTNLSGAEGELVGTGKQNTIEIFMGCEERPIAASLAVDYRGPTLDTLGWHLPSKYELELMYEHRDAIGGFANDNYWSSSEINDRNAWKRNFSSVSSEWGWKPNPYRVRAVRAF